MSEESDLSGKQELFPDTAPGNNPTDSDHLFAVLIRRPTDYEPYGFRVRESCKDCSCGCLWWIGLEGRLGSDWGICANPKSPRAIKEICHEAP